MVEVREINTPEEMEAAVKDCNDQLRFALVQIGMALVPVVQKYAEKISEPRFVEALVKVVDIGCNRMVKAMEKLPEIAAQEEIDDLCKVADEKRKEEFLAWLGQDEGKLNSLPKEQLAVLHREGLCFRDYDNDDKEIYRFRVEADPWNIPSKEKHG